MLIYIKLFETSSNDNLGESLVSMRLFLAAKRKRFLSFREVNLTIIVLIFCQQKFGWTGLDEYNQ